MNTVQGNCISTSCARRTGLWFAAVGLGLGTAVAHGAEGTDTAQETAAEDQVDEVIVTGTRLLGGDATARVEVITAEDIAMQGLTTFEDVVRSIPQNFSTINNSNSLLFGSDLLDTNLGALGLGAATANLRGFGSKNTLVLLNGKRLAGINSSAQQLAANLNDIPAAAIDRVEVVLDGGSDPGRPLDGTGPSARPQCRFVLRPSEISMTLPPRPAGIDWAASAKASPREGGPSGTVDPAASRARIH